MPAGLNARAKIIRYSYDDDDVVGGAMLTGTVLYENLWARLESNKQEQLLLQQGLETERTFDAVVVPGTLDIRERDEFEITAPNDHVYFAVPFRIVGLRYSSHSTRDPRNYLMLSMVRSVRGHVLQ